MFTEASDAFEVSNIANMRALCCQESNPKRICARMSSQSNSFQLNALSSANLGRIVAHRDGSIK